MIDVYVAVVRGSAKSGPREHAPELSIEFTYRGFPEAAVAALLPNVGDTQRKKLAAEASGRLLADLLLPKVPKPRT
jgi:hypothetical protein